MMSWYIFCVAERFACGVGEGVTNKSVLRREIIHRLYISSMSHSELIKYLRVSARGLGLATVGSGLVLVCCLCMRSCRARVGEVHACGGTRDTAWANHMLVT